MRVEHIEVDGSRPLVVFGGPYSNFQATEAMGAAIAALAVPPANVICTGDVVAYAADPEPTSALIRDWGIPVVAGNCEEQIAAGAADCGCGFEEGSACDLLAKGWYPYANALVSPATRAWMGAMPGAITFDYAGRSVRVIHGGTAQVNRFIFASETDVLAAEHAAAGADLVIAGHAGLPFIAKTPTGLWLNAGVIGMPADDGTPDVWYAIIEAGRDGALTIRTRRLAYDHHAAAAAMRRSGHANGYARTLVTGIWPSHDILPATERSATGQRLKARTVKLAARPVPVAAE
ncbi:MAG: metallophosphoesterase family protein [Hyphomicrobiaceae bacterium]